MASVFSWLTRPITRLLENRNRHDLNSLFQIKQQANATAGVRIDEGTALNFVTAFACIKVLSEDLGSLDFPVYQRLPNGGKIKATSNPNYNFLNYAPNAEQPPLIFFETMYSNMLRWGNAYAEIERLNNGRPLELHIIPPNEVEIKRDDQKRLYYKVTSNTSGKRANLYPQDMIHLRCIGNGVQGLSPVRCAREAIALGKAAEQFNAGFYGNGARPGGIISHPKTLTETAQAKLIESIDNRHGGPANYGGWMIVQEDMKPTMFPLPAEDSMFLGLRQFQREEICAIYRVPPAIIGDLSKGTLSNVEQQALSYLQTLRPFAVRIEQEFQRKLFTPAESNQFFCQFDLNSLLRADIVARTNALQIQFMNGALTIDEWRSSEGRNPVVDPTQHFVPVNLQSLATAMAGYPVKPEDVDPPTDDTIPPPASDPEIDDDVEDEGDTDGPFENDVPGYRSALVNLIRLETSAVCRLAKEPETFAENLNGFYKSHQEYVSTAIAPLVPQSADVAAELCRTNREALINLSATVSPNELTDAVFALTSSWESDLPDEVMRLDA